MYALVDALIWASVLLVFVLLVRYASWVQKIWIKNGKWHSKWHIWRSMLMIVPLLIVPLLIVQDIIERTFGEPITAWLIAQEIGFGVLYAVYALLVVALAVMLIRDTIKTSQTSPKWLGIGINVVLCALMLSMPFWP